MSLENASCITLSLSLSKSSRIICACESMKVIKNYFSRKGFLGLALGLVLAIIVLNVDKKLWLPLELETINSRNITSRLAPGSQPTEDIVIVLFDDKTQFLLRQNGLPIKDFEKKGRELIKNAIEKIESNRPKAIGINLNLSSSSDSRTDEELIKVISKFKNIVIADSIYSPSTLSQNKILKSASAVGYGELYADYDRIVHKIKLVDNSIRDIPSFSYALYKISTNKDLEQKVKLKNVFFIKYPKTSFTKYSFIDLLQGKIKASFLRDKIVILGIGLKSKLIRDELFSPYQEDGFVSGTEVQATALSNLLNSSCLFKARLADYPFFFILISMLLGGLFSTMQTFRRLFVATVLLITLMISSQLVYDNLHLILELVPILFLLLGNMIIGSLVFLQLNLQEQNIELEDSQNNLKGKNIQLTDTLSELNSKISELKEVRKQLSSRGEEERKRIARELHDDTLARITDLKRHVEGILISSDLPLNEKKQLSVSIQTLDNVTHEVRRIINALRPSMLDNALGLIPAIENLLDDLSKRSSHRIQTKLVTKLAKLKLSTEAQEINLYRIIQEALNNVFKHSCATKVEIVIEEQPGQVLMLVKDNGIGFNDRGLINQIPTKGFGLIDMKERAELIGVNIQFLSRPDGTGTILEIMIPKENQQGKDTPWRVPTTAGVI